MPRYSQMDIVRFVVHHADKLNASVHSQHVNNVMNHQPVTIDQKGTGCLYRMLTISPWRCSQGVGGAGALCQASLLRYRHRRCRGPPRRELLHLRPARAHSISSVVFYPLTFAQSISASDLPGFLQLSVESFLQKAKKMLVKELITCKSSATLEEAAKLMLQVHSPNLRHARRRLTHTVAPCAPPLCTGRAEQARRYVVGHRRLRLHRQDPQVNLFAHVCLAQKCYVEVQYSTGPPSGCASVRPHLQRRQTLGRFLEMTGMQPGKEIQPSWRFAPGVSYPTAEYPSTAHSERLRYRRFVALRLPNQVSFEPSNAFCSSVVRALPTSETMLQPPASQPVGDKPPHTLPWRELCLSAWAKIQQRKFMAPPTDEQSAPLGRDIALKFNSTSSIHLRDTVAEPDIDELTWWCGPSPPRNCILTFSP